MRCPFVILSSLGFALVAAVGAAVAPDRGAMPVLGREIPVAVAVADGDGDGDADAVTANLDRSVSVLLGRGDGRLARGVAYLAPGSHEAIAAADLDGDGAVDFAVGDDDARVSVLLNAGGGRLRPATRFRGAA